MTKVYSVKPGSNEIRVSDDRVLDPGGPIAWGEKLKSIEMARLCRVIIKDVIGDERQAELLAHRFKWRTVITWNKDAPMAITEDEVNAVVKAIREVEAEQRPFVERAQREQPNYVSDRAGAGQEFTSNPELTPNKPKETSNGN